MNLCQQNPSIKYCRGTGYASGRKLTCFPQKNTLWNPFHSMADSDNCRSNFNIPACERKYRLSFPCISDQWVMVKWILSFSLIILYYIVLVFFLANKRLSLNKQMCQLFRVKKLKKKNFVPCLFEMSVFSAFPLMEQPWPCHLNTKKSYLHLFYMEFFKVWNVYR